MEDDIVKYAGDRNKKQHVRLSVPTCIQMYSWDCGLACASMVLRYYGKDDQNVYTSDLEELKCGQSTWTIDLAFLLRRHELETRYTTTVLGANQNHAKKAFYLDKFEKDEQRVNKSFTEASSVGITVQKKSVDLEEIMTHLEGDNIMIFLVDWAHLECLWCDRVGRNCLVCFQRCCSSYLGHYVVVCGYDLKKKRIYYKNPSYDEEVCCSRIDKFNKARTSSGTDEDIIFISKEKKSNQAGT